MSKFYTNIIRKGNHILYRGYEDGVPVQQKIAYEPHLFVDSPEGEYTLFNSQRKLKKKAFDSIRSMQDFLEQYKDVDNFNVYGCTDIVRQFTASMFPMEIVWDYAKTEIYFLDIETEVSRVTIDPSTMVKVRKTVDGVEQTVVANKLTSLDTTCEVYDEDKQQWVSLAASGMVKNGFPDPTQANERITMITLIQNMTGRSFMWALYPVNADNEIFEDSLTDYRSFDNDEKAMLKDFVLWFASQRVDIISGWNSELFDIPYIVNRLRKVLGETGVKLLSPWREVKERSIRFDTGETKQTYDILGITHLDYLDLYKKFNPGSKESFKLDHIASIELGERKVPMPCETFKEFYTEHWSTFVSYNKQDTMLLYRLEKKLLQVRLAMQLGYLAKCQFADVMSAMRLWESIIYNHFNDNKIVEVLGKQKNERHSIIGAYVHEPVPGRYGWTVSVDATSLYPSIIMQNNISPECIVRYEDIDVNSFIKTIDTRVPVDGEIISANGLVTNTIEGFIPFLVKRMFDLRKKTKDLMLEKKKEEQETIAKILALGGTID